MAKRSLRHIVRSPDTIITVVLSPIALLLMFVYVLAGALGKQTGSIKYVDFITPGIIVMTVISGIAYAAFRLNMFANGFARPRAHPRWPSQNPWQLPPKRRDLHRRASHWWARPHNVHRCSCCFVRESRH